MSELPDFSALHEKYPCGWILRSHLTEATSGILNSRTCANEDSQGVGIEGRAVFGKRKVAYPVRNVIKRLQEIYKKV